MCKIFIVLFSLFFISCSGVEMRKKLFKNSVLIEIEVAESYASISEGELAVVNKCCYEDFVDKKVIVSRFIDNISHQHGKSTFKRYIINVEGLEIGKEYIAYLKLFDEEGEEYYIHYSSLLKFDKDHREIRFFIE